MWLERDAIIAKFKNIICDMWRFFREMQLLQNSRAPFVTCDSFLERCSYYKIQENHMWHVTVRFIKEMQLSQNSRKPYVTCDGFIKEMQC